MKLNRKAAAGVVTAMGAALVLSACGGGGNDAETTRGEIADAQRVGAMEDFGVGTTFKATEPTEISVMYRVHPNYPVNDDWLFFTSLKENQNVTFNRTDVNLADWGNRRSLLVASGDFPEIVPVVWGGEDTAWQSGNILLPFDEYFDYMPNFQHFVQEWGIQDELDAQRSEDGHIYRLPGLRQSPNIEHSFAINTDMFEAAGVTEDPATWDEFADQLAKVQAHFEGQGDFQFALSDRWNEMNSGPLGATLQLAAPNFGTSAGWNRNVQWFDTDSDEFVLRAGTQGTRELVQYFADLVSNGVLDDEITQSDEEAVAKFINGRSAAISTNYPEMQTTIRDAAKDIGKDLNTRMIVVPAGPAGDNIAGSKIGPGIVLNAKIAQQPHFLATLQFIDWLFFSEEGREFVVWGVEGTTFERDADGNRVLAADLGGADADATGILQPEFGFRDGVWMQNWGGSDDLFQSTMPAEQREWLQGMIDRKTLLPTDPGAPLTESENEQRALIEAQVQDGFDQGVAQFILGQRPMSEWDTFVQEIDALGGGQIVDMFNTARERLQGNS